MSDLQPGPGVYADQVRIVHFQLDERGGAPTQSVQVIIDPGGYIDLDWLHAEIKNIHYGTNVIIRQTRSEISWGAAGFQAEFVVETLRSIGTFGAGVGATLLAEQAWEALFRKLREQGHNVLFGRVQPLNDSEAIGHGMTLIAGEYSLPRDSLTARSVSHDRQTSESTVVAEARDGNRYSVTFMVRGVSATLISKSRELPA